MDVEPRRAQTGYAATPNARLAARTIQFAVLFYIVVAGLMHFLQPGYSPVTMPMSAYVLGTAGFLMTLTFFALSLALLATWFGLRSQLPPGWKSRLGTCFILLAAAATVVAGVFPDDGLQPPLLPVSTTGWVHMAAGMIAFPSFLFGPLFLTLALRNHPDWRSRMPALLTVIVLLALAAIWFVGLAASNSMAGLAQRVLFALLFVWLVLIANGLSDARPRQAPG